MVDFCEKCDALIMGKKNQEVSCPSCGHISKAKGEISLKKKIDKKEDFEVFNPDSTDGIYPTTEVECPECKHKEAYYWTKQTRAGDEPETQFFKCVECKHQWRDYR